MDPLAVYAIAKKRDWSAAGNGPVLIETLTYRCYLETIQHVTVQKKWMTNGYKRSIDSFP